MLGVLCVAAYTVAARWKRWPELARAAGLVVLGSLFPLLLLCWYHYAAFGSPLASGYKFLNDAGYMHWHEGGFLGIRLPYAQGFLHSFFSAQRGFFVLSPVFFCAFFGLRDLKQKDKALWVLLVALLVSHTYFTSAFDHTSWGWTPGPRHLTGMLPFLFLPIALLFERLREKPVPLAVVGGLALSSLLCAQLVGHVAYVPPEVSTTVFGLALPLYSGGTLPVSWLAAYVPNPYPGVLLLLLGAAVLVWAALHFRRVRAPLAVMFLAAAAHLGILKLVPHGGKGEDGAVAFMRSVWLAPNDVRVDFSGK